MQFQKKRYKRTRQAKHAVLAASLAATLFCTSPTAYAGVERSGETVDQANAGAAPLVVAAGQTWTTWAGAAQTTYDAYGNPQNPNYQYGVTIESGGIWRPMDAYGATVFSGDNSSVSTLEIKSDGILDLSYKYGKEYWSDFSWQTGTVTAVDGSIIPLFGSPAGVRSITVGQAPNSTTFPQGQVLLHDGAILILTAGGSYLQSYNSGSGIVEPRDDWDPQYDRVTFITPT